MIDRYTIYSSIDSIRKVFGIGPSDSLKPTYNAAPTRKLPVILSSQAGKITPAKWGFISSLSNNKTISPRLFNLASEQAFEKAPYQQMISAKRAVVMADGFYLWKQVSKKQRIPYYFYSRDRTPFGIAAVWEQDDFDSDCIYSFNMLTSRANGFVRDYQEDMPLILRDTQLALWLSQSASISDLKASVTSIEMKDFALHPVSPLIANMSNEGESLIKPSQPSDQYGNYTLFN